LHVTVKENKPKSFLCIWNFLVKKLGETQEEIMQTKLFSYKREHVLNWAKAEKNKLEQDPVSSHYKHEEDVLNLIEIKRNRGEEITDMDVNVKV